VYDVSVTKDETAPLSRWYRAHLDNAERIEDGRLTPVRIDIPDLHGRTVSEAFRGLDARFETWRLDHPRQRTENASRVGFNT
jgi:hypothetical protein